MTARQPLRNAFAAEPGSSTATTYGPYRAAAASGEMPSATTGCFATMSCMMIASPSAVSAPVTSVPLRGFLSHSRSSSSSSGVGSATAETPPSPTRSSPGAPTLESWPYHLRSLGPPSMTSSISSNSPFLPLATTDRRRPRSCDVGMGGFARWPRRSRDRARVGVAPRGDVSPARVAAEVKATTDMARTCWSARASCGQDTSICELYPLANPIRCRNF